MTSTSLNQLQRHEQASVLGFSEELAETSRFLSMGLIPGQPVQVMHTAPLGGPMQIKCNNTLIAVRSGDAAMILVKAL